MDTFGTSNSFTDELWVGKYKVKPLIRKIFAKTVQSAAGNYQLVTGQGCNAEPYLGLID